MASQRSQTMRPQRATAFGQDRDHPGTASVSGCRGVAAGD
jgi:hypothetical protein